MGARAQDTADSAAPPLRVTGLDDSAFPRVELYVASADPLTHVRAAGDALVLEEAGEPVADVSTFDADVGIDLIFVLDANDTVTALDGNSQLTRLEKVRRSIIQFATEYMNPRGLDRISVIVPDAEGENGRFLLRDAATPSEVVEGMLAYDPEAFRLTPLNEMLTQAITHAAQQYTASVDAGRLRFQAVLLFSDGAQLDRQLAYEELIALAQPIELPLFGAILGARADPNEIANVTRLTDATGGSYVHMPEPEAMAGFYLPWQRQGEQLGLSFTSARRDSGRYTLTVRLGEQQVETAYTITLSPPVLSVLLEPGGIVRQGAAVDTPLVELAPRTLTVPVVVAWPDGPPRALAELTLSVNGEAQQTLLSPAPDAAGGLLLSWDMAAAGAGEYALTARVVDMLGQETTSAPVIVTVVEDRPAAPPPTPLPRAAATAVPAPATLVETAVANQPLVGLALGFLALLVVLLFMQRRRRGPAAQAVDLHTQLADLIVAPAEGAAAGDDKPVASAMVALLEWLDEDREPLRLMAETVTFGRDPAAVDVVLEHPSVSRLHARVKRSGDGYWLYDEGSAEGTFVNFERLGLGPRLLQDQHRIQFGRVRGVFRLRPERPSAPTAADESDDGSWALSEA